MAEIAQVDAYNVLRDEILHGELTPGERLPAAELRIRYRLGLTPIREAIMRLASEGLVENLANRGARVREVSLEEFRDLMDTRRAIERLCLTRAMERGDAAWEAECLRALHVLGRAPLPRDPSDRAAAVRWETLHREFHRALVSACGSPWHLHLWDVLADHSARYRKLRLLTHYGRDPAKGRDIAAEHEAITAAVIAREAGHACDLMDRHLARTLEAVAPLLAVPAEAPGRAAGAAPVRG